MKKVGKKLGKSWKKVEKKLKKKLKKSWKKVEKNVEKKLGKTWEKVGKKLENTWKKIKKSWKNFNFFSTFFLNSSPRSNVGRVSSLKSHSFCRNSKVAVSEDDDDEDEGQV